MAIVEEKADECAFWLELLVESGLIKREVVENLTDEANQIVAITVSFINTARGHKG